MKCLPKDFWPWITGFYEGEGSCGCYKSDFTSSGRRRYRIEMSISQKDPRVLHFVQKVLGYGNINRMKGSWGRVYAWRNSAADARRFLKTILPYMRVPKKIKQLKRTLFRDHKYIGPKNTRRDLITGRILKSLRRHHV